MPLAPDPNRRTGTLPAGLLLLLTAAVTAAHFWLAAQVVPSRLGEGAADVPPRIEVAFVRELAPAAPPATPPVPRPRTRSRPAAPAPEAAASAAVQAPADPDPRIDPSPLPLPSQTPEPALAQAVPANAPASAGVEAAAAAATAQAEEASTATVVASAAASSASATASATSFEWPPSTRLTYRLTGHFRGPVEGQARVEWLRSGTRYQVHLDVSVGPAFAPLMSRRISSEGEVTDQGLQPALFDEETRMLWRDARRLRIEMGPDLVRLPRGQPIARPAGLQDTASQFVQLTWLFTTQPGLLQAGQTIPLPLALPQRIQLWQYEVGESETLDTPAGPVLAVHVRPRPDAASEARRGGDLVPEAWFAPSLQYLPVRIFIRQDSDNYIDLVLERLPQQAEGGR